MQRPRGRPAYYIGNLKRSCFPNTIGGIAVITVLVFACAITYGKILGSACCTIERSIVGEKRGLAGTRRRYVAGGGR